MALIGLHHAHHPPAVTHEERLIRAELLGEAQQDSEYFMQRVVKTLYDVSKESDYGAWVRRFSERQHPAMWQRFDPLAASWAKVHARALRSGDTLETPPGLDPNRVAWVFSPPESTQRFSLHRSVEALVLERADVEARDHGIWADRGSPVAEMSIGVPLLQWQRRFSDAESQDEDVKVHSMRVDADRIVEIPLANCRELRLRTDYDELVIDSISLPDWAFAMGRDREGLFVELPREEGGRRAYWFNPGSYVVEGKGTLEIEKGFFLDEDEFRQYRRHGFRKPDWADVIGTDEYGLYADFSFRGVVQRMRWIAPGSFEMGSLETEAERYDNELLHEVVLTRGFWLGDTACTQALWETVMGKNLSNFKGTQRPVENVSWEDTQAFIERFNGERQELELRLPTEAEWEYSCRAGTNTPFWFGENIDPEQVNYNGNYPYAGGPKGRYRGETVEVKSLPGNEWGLYEMHGNVWEWCSDWYEKYPTETMVDPAGPSEGAKRVLRGGSWIGYGRIARSAFRFWYDPGYRYVFFGFRLARGQQAGGHEKEKSRAGQTQRSGVGQALRERFKKWIKKQ